MATEMMYGKFAEYFDDVFAYKDYGNEVRFINWAVSKHKKSPGKYLLDVGCGTGSHAIRLQKKWVIFGIDKSSKMIEIAKQKIKGGKFFVKDMKTFKLGTSFDVIICMFSAINYNLSNSELSSTLRRFYEHLNVGGVLIFDLYNNKDTYVKDTVRIRTVKKGNVDLAVISQPKVDGEEYRIGYIYLMKKNGRTDFSVDNHVRGIFGVSEVLAAMKKIGFVTQVYRGYSKAKWSPRAEEVPLFVGRKSG